METPKRKPRLKKRDSLSLSETPSPQRKPKEYNSAPSSPRTKTAARKDRPENASEDNIHLASPGAWLQFKTVMKSPWIDTKKKHKQPTLNLSHLDSIELRGRVVPRTPQRKTKTQQTWKEKINPADLYRSAKKTSFLSQDSFLFSQKMLLARIAALCLFAFLISLARKKTPSILPGPVTESLARKLQQFHEMASEIKRTQSETHGEVKKRGREQEEIEKRLLRLATEMEKLRSKKDKEKREVDEIKKTTQLLRQTFSKYFVLAGDPPQNTALTEDFLQTIKNLAVDKAEKEMLFNEFKKELGAFRLQESERRDSLEKDSSTLKTFIRDVVVKELQAQKKNQNINYALAANGASVVHSMTSKRYASTGRALSLLGIGVYGNPPETALGPDMAVGSCWPFNGSTGSLTVQLPCDIYPTEFELHHIPWSISPYRSRTSIKEFSVLGYATKYDLKTKRDSLLCTGTYNIHGRQSQLFPIKDPQEPVRFVRLQIKSNNGENFTAVYHIGVYGESTADRLARKNT
ncbi:MAG: SUN domain-containing protein [Amphiamblys sp. WSBS2006]|nr:MAG: SUN domain-containing protein [Amphiamblys sp. WSBS2006]